MQENWKTHVVCSIPCCDCENPGQSKCQFGTCLKGHYKVVSTLAGESALAEHVCDTKHVIALENLIWSYYHYNNRHGLVKTFPRSVACRSV